MYLTLLSEKVNILGGQEEDTLVFQVPPVDLLDNITE
jgi:hypothetical protein